MILASASEIRAQLLRRAQVPVHIDPARIDEDSVRAALLSEGATPRDIADTLADMKARNVANRSGEAQVLGADQVLACEDVVFSKPVDPADCRAQLSRLSGRTHRLFSAAVLYEDGFPVWRHVGVVSLHMRPLSPGFIERYVDRNWESVQHSVGGYKLEEEGARLFTSVEGDFFHVLGLPLLELLSFLILRGDLDS